MAFKAVSVTVPGDASEVTLADDVGSQAGEAGLAYRNTGTVDCLVGGPGTCLFPLKAGEILGVDSRGGLLSAKIASGSSAGTIVVLEDR